MGINTKLKKYCLHFCIMMTIQSFSLRSLVKWLSSAKQLIHVYRRIFVDMIHRNHCYIGRAQLSVISHRMHSVFRWNETKHKKSAKPTHAAIRERTSKHTYPTNRQPNSPPKGTWKEEHTRIFTYEPSTRNKCGKVKTQRAQNNKSTRGKNIS